MTPEIAKKWMPIIQAVAEGHTIQRMERVSGGSSVWVDCPDIESVIDWCPDCLQVKPESKKPREFWITRIASAWLIHETKGAAITWLHRTHFPSSDHEIIHVREVIDE